MKHGSELWIQGILLLLLMVAGLAIYMQQAPPAAGIGAPATDFSSERAMHVIQALARQPHPAGTGNANQVHETIMQTIRQCGINPQMQDTVVSHGPGAAASVRNILARLPGTASTKAVALAAHYDSVASGPGAADDGTGVAALLETLRALKAGPPLHNDVLFLFTDGEEGVQPKKGLNGAYAFALQHPWAKDIGLLLNFDARGVYGPSYMYRSSPDNGWPIRTLATAGGHPLANSGMAALVSLMPTGSDFSAFREAGIPCMDFAFVGGLPRYHTSLDTPENLDRCSLQHQGDYALHLAQGFGNMPLDRPATPPVTYFNTIGSHMAVYPVSWARPLAAAVLLALAALFAAGIKRGVLTVGNLLRGTAVFLAYTAVATCLAAGVVALVYAWRGFYLLYCGDRLTLALLCLAVWSFFHLLKRYRTTRSMLGLSAGVLSVWAVLSAVTAIGLPEASFLFVWPLLFRAAGFALLVFHKTPENTAPPSWICMVLGLTALPAVLLIAPILYSLHVALTAIFAPVVVLFFVLALGLLVPHMYWIVLTDRRLLPAAALALGLLLLLAAASWPGFSRTQPRFTSLSYVLDTDTHEAFWLSASARSDEWTSALIPREAEPEPLPEFLSDSTQNVLRGPAPTADLEPVSITVAEDTPTGNGRHLRLRVSSPTRAPRVVLFTDAPAQVQTASVNGVSLPPVAGRWVLDYCVFPAKGIELAIDIEGKAPFHLTAVDHTPGLPVLEPNPVPPRPPHLIVQPNTPDLNHGWLKSNMTLVKKTFTL